MSDVAGETEPKKRILIVEDEPLIASAITALLMDNGFRIAGTATRLPKALALIETVVCDAAIIDANLAGVSASPAATALADRGCPFLILSGYSLDQLHPSFPNAVLMQKPYRDAELIAALTSILLPPR